MIVGGQEAAESLFNHQSIRREDEDAASPESRESKEKESAGDETEKSIDEEEEIECREEAVGLCL